MTAIVGWAVFLCIRAQCTCVRHVCGAEPVGTGKSCKESGGIAPVCWCDSNSNAVCNLGCTRSATRVPPTLPTQAHMQPLRRLNGLRDGAWCVAPAPRTSPCKTPQSRGSALQFCIAIFTTTTYQIIIAPAAVVAGALSMRACNTHALQRRRLLCRSTTSTGATTTHTITTRAK